MAHTSPRGHVGRDENLLATCSLAIAERVLAATEEAAEAGAGAPAALVALNGFLRGGSIDALRRVLGLSHPGAVRLVDRLAARGLLQRLPASDGRAVSLVPTPEGDAVAARILERRRVAMAELLDTLDAPARAGFTLLERLLGTMTTDHDSAGHMCRMCDADACGHPEICPVTIAARHA